MGILSFLGDMTPRITAQKAPQIITDNFYQLSNEIARISRKEGMSIPAAAKCRNLIVNLVSQTEIELYKKSTDEELALPVWMEQPSVSQPYTVTMALTTDALFWYGVAYWQVTETYADDGRPARFEFVLNERVTWDLNLNNTYVTQYYVNGEPVPMSGLGSLVTFQMTNEGVLNYGASLLRQAKNLQDALSTNVSVGIPQGIIKNNGADLPPDQVEGLLNKWNLARKTKPVAFLTQALEFIPTQFSARDQQMVEVQSNMATQIARLCNVPAYYLSADQNRSMTYSNLDDENKHFIQQTLSPYFNVIEGRLSMDDITRQGHEVKFDLDSSILRPDPMARLNVTEKMLNLGLISIEEAQIMNDITPKGNQSGTTNIQQ
jgi:HK97 family phage portal protein